MADRKFEIKVDIVSDPNGTAKAKSAIKELEREAARAAKESERLAREEARRQQKITDDLLNYKIRAAKEETAAKSAAARKTEAEYRQSLRQQIAEGKRQLAEIDRMERQAFAAKNARFRQSSNAFLQSLKTQTAAAKQSGNEIQRSLDGAFKNVSIAGAAGGLAGGLVASFASAFSQLPGIVKTQIDEMVRIASERQNAFKGLASLSNFLGISQKDTQDAIQNLRLVRAGVVEIGDATIGLKNLLASGFSLPEAIKLLEAFSDTAAFGKASALDFGEAIRGATEGIKNGNSILVDNVGLTKNLSAILKDAGFQEKDLSRVKDDLNVRMALYNGLLKEALPQLGDADKLTKGWTGSTAALTAAQNNLYAAIGDVIINNKELLALVQTLTADINGQTAAVQNAESGWKKSISSMTSAFADFVVSVRTGIRAEIADLQELLNYIKIVALAIPALDDKLSPWTGGEALRQYNEAINRIGTFHSQALQQNQSFRDIQNRNVVRNMGMTPGTGPFFSNYGTTRIGGSQGPQLSSTVTVDPNTKMFVMKPRAGTTMNAGGGTPKTKSKKVNLNLKNEMSDALEIAARYGLVVTSGKDSKHNKGSAHYSGEAIDIRTEGVNPTLIAIAMREFAEAGYNVKDERVRPAGQKVWSSPHVHVSSVGRTASGDRRKAVNEIRIQDEISSYLRSQSDRETKQFREQMVDQFLLGYSKSGLLPSQGMVDRIVERLGDIKAMTGERRPEKSEVERDLANALSARLTGRTPSVSAEPYTPEEFWFPQQMEELPENPLEKEIAERNKEIWENFQRERENAFEDAKQDWADLLTDLANGDFSSVWRNFKSQMLQQFIQPASAYLAQMFGGFGNFGGGFGGMQPSISGGFNLGSIFGGGPVFGGVGGGWGTPPFNPNTGGGFGNFFSGGSSGSMFGGLGSVFGSIFGKSGASAQGGLGHEMGHVLGGSSGILGTIGSFLPFVGMALPFISPLISGLKKLFGFGDNSEKKLKEAALNIYSISVKDKSVLKSLKRLGETMFGKRVGENAEAVVSSDEGQLILRNYAEASGQSSSKMDAMHIGDENWKGNQFRSRFGGFRAFGGPVTAGKSYVVGEFRPEVFTPTQNGVISPSVGGMSDAMVQRLLVVLSQVEETQNMLHTKIAAMRPGDVVGIGANENPEAVGQAVRTEMSTSLRGSERNLRAQGVY